MNGIWFENFVSKQLRFSTIFLRSFCISVTNTADWEKLGDEITNPNILIAEVDCTDEDSNETCETNDVEGFPTLMFGDGGFLDGYDGSREYDDLLKFANETMKPSCSPSNIEMCDAEQKADIQKYMVMSLEDLEAEIQSIEDMLDEFDDSFEDSTLFLEDEYVKIEEEAERKKSQAKTDSDYSTLKAVLANSKKESGSHSEL